MSRIPPAANSVVRNQARLTGSLGVFTSNIVVHPVECPPVIPEDHDNPPYAEDEIQIYPYPLVTGQPTDVSVRVRQPAQHDADRDRHLPDLAAINSALASTSSP